MQLDTFSQNIQQLSQVLTFNITKPDWPRFTQLLLQQSRCQGLDLTIPLAGNNIKLMHGIKTDQLVNKKFELQSGQVHFVFYSQRDTSGVEHYWQHLSAPLQSLLELLEQRLSTQSEHSLKLQAFDSMRWGVLYLNHQAQLLEANALARGFIEQGLLQQQQNKINLYGLPHWLNRQIEAFKPQMQHSQSVQLHFDEREFNCLLIQQSADTTSWLPQNQCFYLIIRPLHYQPRAQNLMSMLNLTHAQAEIAALACQGLSATQIAAATQYKKHTVYSYLKQLYRQLDIHSQAQLAAKIWPALPF